MFCGETTAAMWVHSSRSRGGKRRHVWTFSLSSFSSTQMFSTSLRPSLKKKPQNHWLAQLQWFWRGRWNDCFTEEKEKKTAKCLDSRRPSVESRKEQKGGDTWLCLVATAIRIKLNQTNTQTNIVATLWFRDAATQGASVVFITRRASWYSYCVPLKRWLSSFLRRAVVPECSAQDSSASQSGKKRKRKTTEEMKQECWASSSVWTRRFFFFYTLTEQQCRAEAQGQQGVKSPHLNRSIQKIQNKTFVK